MTQGVGRHGGPRRTKCPSRAIFRNSTAILPWLLCGGLLVAGFPAHAGGTLPTGGKYVAGQGTISGSNNGLTINQSTQNGIINWQGFSIGAGNTVQFNNGSGATLNRVVGADISRINGSLSATGSVYLVNPQGVVIGPGGKVVTNGSFVASTRDISNNSFMSGGPFTASGTSNGSVVNAGAITSSTGNVILVGRSVSNKGSISAPNGTATLAAGDNIVLQPVGGDPRIAVSGGKGDVTNTGAIKAAQAQLSAAGGNVYALAGNSGVVSATGTKTVDGHVWLTAGGTAEVSGTVSATNADGSGGAVTVRGTDINVSGQVDASATAPGQTGGSVSVIATGTTNVSGTIKAEGGRGGKGGFVETSGHTLDIGGATVDAGQGGAWLLDPYDLTVDSSAASTIDTTLGAGTDVTLQTTASGTSGPGTADSSGSGDITIASPLSWSTSATLTLDAYHGVNIDAGVTVSGGGKVVLTTNDGGTGGDYLFGGASSLQFTGGSGAGASLTINSTAYTLLYSASAIQSTVNTSGGLSGHYALATSVDASSTTWKSIGTDGAGNLVGSGFTGTFEGLGNTISNVTVNQGHISSTVAGQYAGVFGYDAGTIRDVGVLGVNVTGGFETGGLAGFVTSGGTILRSYSTGTVSGVIDTGGLVGFSQGTLSQVYSTATVNAVDSSDNSTVTHTPFRAQFAGGLAGVATGTVTNVYATGNVTGTSAGAAKSIAGLIGANGATLTNAYATGAVSASSGATNVHGAIGNNSGTITDVYYNSDTAGVTDTTTGVTGETTSQLQAGPSGLNASPWVVSSGAYPNLTFRTLAASDTVSGTVYSDYGVTPLGGANVIEAWLGGGAVLGSATSANSTGAYSLTAPSSSGTLLLFLDNSGGNYATTVVKYSGSSLTGVNLYGGYLNVVNTSAASVSAVLQGLAGYVQPSGGYSANDFLLSVSGSTVTPTEGLAISATGSIAVDQSLTFTGSNGLALKSGSGDITIDNSISLASGTLAFDSYQGLNINAKVTVSGAGTVSLTTNDGGSGGDYLFSDGSSLQFTGGSGSGASLNINGSAYTLIYDATSLQNLNNANSSLQGNIALATAIDLASASWTPLGTDGNNTVLNSGRGFSGTFTGLGNTISNLKVSLASGIDNGGLFGDLSGTVRNVGLTSGSVSGRNNTGGLVGHLVSGHISNSYASVSVSASSPGGLVGWSVNGTITNSFATGSVVGTSNAGGLVGTVTDTQITNVYATGSVKGATGVGGLIGSNTGTVTNAYATGAVSGNSLVGGLIGANGGTVSNSFWDTQTTGQAHSGGGTGETTAQLQGTLPGTFSSSVWGTGTGLYPYFKWQYPSTPQAITGNAYYSGGKSLLTSGSVTGLVNGTLIGSTGIGADGYYYLLAPAGTITSGAAVLAYSSSGARLDSATATGNISGFDIWGSTLIAPTTASSYSAANATTLQAQNSSLLSTAEGSNTAAQSFVNALSNYGYLASGDFTIDQTLTLSNGLYVKAGGAITVANALTLPGSNALHLEAIGDIDINANITVSGSGAVSLTTGTDYSIAVGESVQFTGGSGSGASLTINGSAYTLLYSLSDVQNVNASDAALQGNYALAASFDAASTSNWTPIGTDGAGNVGNANRGYSGTFTGLGNTISNLKINKPSSQDVGLFGYSTGTLRNVGLVGGSVTGQTYVGALAGDNYGTISQSYATGTVSGSSFVGGLVGVEGGGTITKAYATGAVSAGSGALDVGGLVGFVNYAGAAAVVTSSYATGAVSAGSGSQGVGGLVGGSYGDIESSYATGVVSASGGSSTMGGLLGFNNGTLANSYWDTSTNSAGVAGVGFTGSGTGSATGESTAQLQGTLPSGFDSSVWATGSGLYPYLKWAYPTTPQAISGTVYKGAGADVAASGSSGAVTVTLDGGGKQLGTASTGANGYYYILLPGGSIANGSDLLVSTPTNGSLAVNAAILATSTYTSGAPAQTNINLYGGFLSEATTATTLSGAPSLASFQTAANTVAGSDSTATSVISAITKPGYLASGASFTVDQAYSGNGFLVSTASGSPITVSNSVTITDGGALALLSGGALSISAPITAEGAVAVNFAYDSSSDANLSFGLTNSGFSGALTFTKADGSTATSSQGGSFSLNGNSYTLLYSLSDLSGINTDSALQLNYALATNLDDANAAWTPLGTDGAGTLKNSANGFSGSFTGLGHTVSNLNVNTGSAQYAGLFGQSIGAIRDIGIVGGTVTGGSNSGGLVGITTAPVSDAFATATVSGNSDSGGLVGYALSTISNAYATGTVTGNGNAVGGLVGLGSGSTISNSHATGAVYGNGLVGGLVGSTQSDVTNTYATGTVTASGNEVGGLIGSSGGGLVRNSFAMGAVYGNGFVGGLIGTAFAPVIDTYATGAVQGSSNVGGLLGESLNNVAHSYWDTQTSGTSTGIGKAAGGSGSPIGLTTRQLQGLDTVFGSAFSLSSNLSDTTGTIWGGGTGGLFPYLKSFFSTGVQAVSGTAYNAGGGTALAGGSVTALVNGAAVGTASTGANGYYYVLASSGTVSSGAAVLAMTSTGARVSTAALDANNNLSSFDIWGSALIAPTTATTYSTASATTLQSQNTALITNAVGSNAAASTLVAALTNYGYIASGAFTVDQALTLSNGLYVKSGGNITVANALTLPGANGLDLEATSALTISAPITVSGAGRVVLAYDSSSATNLWFGLTSTGFTGSLDFGASNNGASLSINGTPYTLLYTLADLQAVNTSATTLSGTYALATSLDASSTASWTPIGSNASNFTGTLEGLGHTVSNLTLNLPSTDYVGLFGYSTGTLRDVGMVGGSVTGHNNVGPLAGESDGAITGAYATGTASGYDAVGGLTGVSHSITASFATGNVSGATAVGGLTGQASHTLASADGVTSSFASGIVSGTATVGGLIGELTQWTNVSSSYATGPVSGSSGSAGALVGSGDDSSQIITSYATGLVTGPNARGLVGAGNGGWPTNSYWDTQTTGYSNTASGSGLTTAQLQGTLPSGFDSSVWGTGAGLYPYLKIFFPNGAQAISGTAYNAGGGTALSGDTVVALVQGNTVGTASTGANGYYYVALQAGTVSGGNAVLAYETDANNGVRVDSAALDVNGNLSGFDIWDSTLIAPTATTTYSAATASPTQLQTEDAGLIAHAIGGHSDPTVGLTNFGYIASGAFTIDQALTLSNGLYVKSAGSITVANALTLPGSNGLALDASDTLTINATVNVTGAGRVELATGQDTTTATGFSIAKLAFGSGDSIDFTGGSTSGASLAINGSSYTLLYSMSDVQAINASDTALQGNYALATSLDASGTTGWQPIGTTAVHTVSNSSSGFSGSFEGLNHAISNLNVDFGVAPGANMVGLFGFNSGTLRDVSLSGGSVRGYDQVGMLAGLNFHTGVIYNVSSSGTVTGVYEAGGLIGIAAGAVVNDSSSGSVTSFGPAGGLIGESGAVVLNASSSATVTGEIIPGSGSSGGPVDIGGLIGAAYGGSITNSHASGDVTADGASYMGGLIGSTNVGVTVSNTYATGNVTATSVSGTSAIIGGLIGDSYDAVTNSYATGNVTGEQFVGGLIGYGQPTSSVARSYATGSVSGDANSLGLGGLIGANNGISVDDAYAFGAVTGGDQIGGLFGSNAATVNNVYATGLVRQASGAPASTFIGALIGVNTGTVTNAYWNTETSGQTAGFGVDGSGTSTATGATTADMQGGIPASFDGTIWGEGSGLYPYFQWRYATAPDAITGKAYTNGGGAALAGGNVTIQLNGTLLNTVITGANGYYYQLVDSGTITTGTAVLASTDGANAGARVDSAAGGPVSEFDIWGSTLIAPTTAGTYSVASASTLQSQDAALISTAVGSNAAAATLIAGLSHYGYISGLDFTIDQALTLSNGLYIMAPGNITVSNALTLPGSNALTLNAADAIAINAPVSVTGAGRVELVLGSQVIGCGCSGVRTLSLSFGSGDHIDYGATNNGGSLSINGDAYTLLYSAADIQGTNVSDLAQQGNYALATSIDATGVSGWVPVGVDTAGNPFNGGAGFMGNFEGLGNSVSNLTVTSINGAAGFFGMVSGTVRDLSLSNMTVSGTGITGALAAASFDGILINDSVSGTVNGGDTGPLGVTGGLVGLNFGFIENAHTAVAVDGADSLATGGLVGFNIGFVENSTATGAVTGTTNSSGPFSGVGGLVGVNGGEINLSAASGAVTSGDLMPVGGLAGANISFGPGGGLISNSFATGAVQGGNGTPAGGLVGVNEGAGIEQSYATGNVTAGDDNALVGGLVGVNGAGGGILQSFATGSATGGTGAWVGGLIGDNIGDIAQSYATGAAQAGDTGGFTSSLAGGLVGENEAGATIHESYSTGYVKVSDATGAAGGFIGANDSTTPSDVDANYFDTLTSGTGVGVGTGNAVNGVTGQTTTQLQSALPTFFDGGVWGFVDGKSYPYLLWRFPTTPDVVSGTVLTAQGGSVVPGETVNVVAGGAVTGTTSSGANGYYNVLVDGGTIAPNGVLAYYQDSASGTGGGTFTDGVSGAATGLDIYNNLRIVTPDANLSTVSTNFIATIGSLFGSGLTSVSDFIGLPTINTDLQIEASNSFTVDQTINAPQAVIIESAGSLTIANGAKIDASGTGRTVVLSAANSFVNNEGSDAIGITGGGSWLVYSSAPAGDTFNNLDSGNTAIWDADITSLAPSAVSQSGNRYVFAYQPTLTFQAANASKTYGDTADVSGDYTVTGYQSGVSGAYLGDTATTAFSGTPTLSSTGAVATAQVSGSPYDIEISAGTLAGLNGYAIAVNATPAQLTVNQKALTITADDASKTYGDTLTFAGSEFTVSGLVNSDSVSTVSLSSAGATGTATVAGSPYAIDASSASGSGLGNYSISYVNGALTVTKRAITVTADAKSRIYGDSNPAFTDTITAGNLVNGDSLTGSPTTGATATSNVGGYAITQGTLAASTNYALTFVSGTLTITARPITVTADDLSRVYGTANPAFTYSVGGKGLVNGDTLSGTLGTVATAASNVGGYAINQGSLAASSNYTLSFTPGTLTITPATVTVSLTGNVEKTYDGTTGATLAAANYVLVGIVGSDAVALNNSTTGTYDNKNVGSGKTVTVTGLTLGGSASGNYTLAASSVSGAVGVVDPAKLTIDADNITAFALSLAQPTVTYSGFANGESSSLVTGLQYALLPVAGTSLQYDIVPFGASAPNYAITYLPGLLTLNPPPPKDAGSAQLTDGGYTTVSNFILSGYLGVVKFSNVATASIGNGPEILLFRIGLPGELNLLQPIAISDYSNATADSDRLVTP